MVVLASHVPVLATQLLGAVETGRLAQGSPGLPDRAGQRQNVWPDVSWTPKTVEA
jgi:hypothetical protein